MQSLLKKIGNSFILGFCGIFLGAFLGFFLSSSYYFVKYFFSYALVLFIVIFVYKFFRMSADGFLYRLLGSFSASVCFSIILFGIPGFLLLTVGEDIFINDFDTIIIAFLIIITALITAIYIPLRSVWADTKISRWFDQNIRGFKHLLGIKN